MSNLITAEVLEILAEIEESVGDVLDAKTMPRDAYVSKAFYEFEKEAVFARSWMCLGRADTVKEPGDYVRIDIDTEPLIIVRDSERNVRVLSAVCAHRGHLVTDGAGNCGKLFRCPLHGWTYGLDGTFQGAPYMDRTASVEQLRAEGTRLYELQVEIWNGFVFANMDPNAEPFRPSVRKLEKEFENYRMDELVSLPTVDISNNHWNWKAMLENGIEPYHTAFLHHTIHDWAHARLSSFVNWDDEDGAIFHPTGFYPIDGNFNAIEKSLFPVMKSLGEKERHQVIFATIPPTLFMGALPDNIFYYLILPTGPETWDQRIGMCYPEETLRLPMFDRVHQATVDGVMMFVEQDNDADVSVQRGQRSRLRRRGRYSYMEETLVQQNRWLLKRYRSYIDDVTGGGYEELMRDARANVVRKSMPQQRQSLRVTG